MQGELTEVEIPEEPKPKMNGLKVDGLPKNMTKHAFANEFRRFGIIKHASDI